MDEYGIRRSRSTTSHRKKPPRQSTKKGACCQNAVNILIGISVFILILSVCALIFAAFQYYAVEDITGVYITQANGVIPSHPFTTHLSAAAVAQLMTLPNDLSPYIGGPGFTVFSTTAQIHTITIQSGVLSSTWDGVNTVATFGGAVGDGLKFDVISKNRIVATPINVAFS